MDTELNRTIIACIAGGGLIFFFGLWMFKSGFSFRKIRVAVADASVRTLDGATFDVQVDLDIDTKREAVCFKEVIISHRVWSINPDTGNYAYPVTRFINHPGYCLLDVSPDTFLEEISVRSEYAIGTSGMRLSAGKYRSVSVIDRIILMRPTDRGDLGWPTDGWILTLQTNERKIEIPFCFAVHGSNRLPVFCRDYVSPPMPFACG